MHTLTKLALTSLALMNMNIAAAIAGDDAPKPVAEQLVDTMTKLAGGPHAGYRANHAKGIVANGEFQPSASAATITKAAYMQAVATPVTVRFSDATGVPNIPDADGNSFPKGMAIRFQLPDHAFTDVVLISVNGFPAATPEDFLGLLNAVAASSPNAQKPSPVEQFLDTHPAALKFVTTPKLPPVSFATQPFFGVNAFKFTNANGKTHYGRYRIEPLAGQQFLDNDATKRASANYLVDELPVRLKQSVVKYRISLQIAEDGDSINDATKVWPETRKIVELGILSLNAIDPNGEQFAKNTMFNPLVLVDGIEPSDDPILLARPAAYAVSYGRRLSGN